MTHEEQMTALYQKIAAEQKDYRDWLLSQPPDEILNHSYEYTIREDIVMEMEALDLTPAQASVLLSSRSPLADIYKDFSKLETSHMDAIRGTIEQRADAILAMQQEQNQTPLYRNSAEYARTHGELPQYISSRKANIACKSSIETAIRENFDGMHLSDGAVQQVMGQFPSDRIAYVLAATIKRADWDQRYSTRNREWAETVPQFGTDAQRLECLVSSHPAVLDGFIRAFRTELAAEKEQPDRKPSIKAQLAAKPISGGHPAEKNKDREVR